MAEIQEKSPTRGSVQHINPDGLPKSPAFTQAVAVSGPVKTVYVGAQLPVDASGALIGKGDIAAQTEQVLKNVQTCLEAAGAGPEHLIQWNIYVVQDQPIQPGFEAGMRWWGNRLNPPANTVFYVAGFPLLPDVLVTIDAIAVVPEELLTASILE
jgi:enamine deaminase RidA (YjgF/YER057c/UK114 family)